MSTARRPAAPLDAFVLHRYDWSESSLILDVLTRTRGRMTLAAKGAKRPYSQMRSVLLPFQRLAVTVGRQAEDAQVDVLTLRSAEWAGQQQGQPAAAVLPAARLFAGFYLNELLMKLLGRGDAHPELFDAYADSLRALAAADELGEQIILRAFELTLLRSIGLLPELDRVTSTQRPLLPRASYELRGDLGVVEADPPHLASTSAGQPALLSGDELAALDRALQGGALFPLQTACAPLLDPLRPVLRGLLHYHLGSPRLRTREVMRQTRQLGDIR